ncbi:MAG: PSD1 and planctomycete cytochrome C domain-containing protein [Planctomycetota bacterium]|nr:PSD1 and planctomycete cytochrome C domain-containing protein [Planctomycetota bacterium]
MQVFSKSHMKRLFLNRRNRFSQAQTRILFRWYLPYPSWLFHLMIGVLCYSFLSPVTADDNKGLELFETTIRPALIQHCYSCHSVNSPELKGELRLDSRPGMRRGGQSGAVITPGAPQDSLLIDAIHHRTRKMPPDKKLPDDILKAFEQWITLGAPDPRDREPTDQELTEQSWQNILQSRRDWWSLNPIQHVSIPDVRNTEWVKQPLDYFILNRHEQQGFTAASKADNRTLIRRLTFTLTGLPPSLNEVEQFVDNCKSDPDAAYQKLVEQLLKSPHFGEHWARHWMDVVRFSETHGNEWNYEVHYAWRYRDYLVRAFNNDLPFDDLVREHIAGDLIQTTRTHPEKGYNESIIGTAFYRFGEINHDDCISLRSIGYDILANQVDTLTKAFQASTVACARCHDHKIDAFSTRDYYSLLGILRSSRLVAHTIDPPDLNEPALQQLEELKPRIRSRLAELWVEESDHFTDYLIATEAARTNQENAEQTFQKLNPERLEQWKKALAVENATMDDPAYPWISLTNKDGNVSIAKRWTDLTSEYINEHGRRRQSNQNNYEILYDLREGSDTWKASGHSLTHGVSKDGELAFTGNGDLTLQGLLPAGVISHRLTPNLGGSYRSPILHTRKKYLSLQVLGGERAAVRIVSNNCQLNYVNYKVLLSDQSEWITFEPAGDHQKLRAYIEILTKFDNPKFPDQLATIGGAKANDRVPWDDLVDDPRSFFGISKVVLHDKQTPPQSELDNLCSLFQTDEAVGSVHDLAIRYTDVLRNAVQAWSENRSTPEQNKWVDWLIRNQLLPHSLKDDSYLEDLVGQYRRIEKEQIQQPRIIPGVEDVDNGINQPLLIRGNSNELGEPVTRRFIEVLDPDRLPFNNGSGRHELAERIASADNPLTARVMANRVWHHLFGAGIVRTVDDFGRLGDQPSHPALLDHLALHLVNNNWSLKELIRSIVLSSTFRMSSRQSEKMKTKDPLNRLMHHYPARRLDAESIRDALLATSGRLDKKQGGSSIYPFRETSNADRRLFAGPLDGDGRRSLYIKTNLMEPARFLSSFNTPGGKVTEGRRDLSNVPAQALALLNDPFVIQQSKLWAEQLIEMSHSNPDERLHFMFLHALGRPITTNETQQYSDLARKLAGLYEIEVAQLMSSVRIWKDIAHVVFNLKEFIFLP